MKERVRPGAFLLSLPSSYQAYDVEELGEGYDLAPGTLLARVAGALVPYDPEGSDDSEKPVGVLMGAADTREGARNVALLVRGAEINATCLAWPEGTTDEQKSEAVGWLAANSELKPRGIVAIAPEQGGDDYVGPFDLVSGAIVGYSQRALAAAFTDPVIRLAALGTGEEFMNFAADVDHAVSPAAVHAWLESVEGESASGLVFFDQSGNGYDTGESAPAWTDETSDGLPAFLDSNSFSGGAITFPGGAMTLSFVVDSVLSEGGGAIMMLAALGASIEVGTYADNPNEIYAYLAFGPDEGFWQTPTLLAAGRHLVEVQVDAEGNVAIFVDGANVNVALSSGTAFPLPAFNPEAQFIGTSDGNKVYEVIVWPAVTSAARANQLAYYGIA